MVAKAASTIATVGFSAAGVAKEPVQGGQGNPGSWGTSRYSAPGLGLALIGSRRLCRADGLFVGQVIVLDRRQIGVEFIHQRLGGGDVETDDRLVRDAVRYLMRAAGCCRGRR